ncbi:hypothetical protein RISK_001031 [Rhodopirellula islandica]|uniref:Uncharacterized protein n=1 Tax=Rhodopirellula islandica TaxID=595434 RepID=A0A0J1BL26_RHOIS|nr:hypothetical protein RISK_001031 [Rhodopirellula islandica]
MDRNDREEPCDLFGQSLRLHVGTVTFAKTAPVPNDFCLTGEDNAGPVPLHGTIVDRQPIHHQVG